MTERDLTLRVTANAEQAKTELAEVQEAQQGLVTSTNQATTATTASTGAMRDQGDAAAQSSDQVSDASSNLNDLGNAASIAQLTTRNLAAAQTNLGTAATETAAATVAGTAASQASAIADTQQAAATNTVVLALREARASMTALAAAATVGGTEMTAALGRASLAMAALQLQLKAGGTAAQQAGLAALETQYAALLPTLGKTSTATAGLTENHKLLSLSASAAGKAIAGHELSAAKLATGMLKLVGPVVGAVTVIALLPQVIKLVIDKTNEWSTKIGESIAGLDMQDGVVRKAGESMADYTKRANEAADADAHLQVARRAAIEGTIGWTRNEKQLNAELDLHQAAARGALDPTEKLDNAAKALGITLPRTYSSDTAGAVKTFLELYSAELKKGQATALDFAEINKGAIETWIKAYQNAGEHIPPALVEIASKIAITNERWKETKAQLEEQVHHLRDYWEACNKARDATHGLAQSQEELRLMVEMSSSQTFRLADGMEISNSRIEQSKAVTDDLVEALKGLSKELYGVDAASDKAFATDEGEAQ